MLLVGTRKGLFTIEDGRVVSVDFLGDPVSMVLAVNGDVYAALNLGHFGVKLKRRRKGGAWEELGVPEYPKVEGGKTLKQIWSLESGGGKRLWAGTIPGGLFRSDDEGASWRLVESLWERQPNWSGGGYDEPGIHSICLDGRRVYVGVSTGGTWASDDEGKTWKQSAHGMRAEYMPPEKAFDPDSQDPHRIVRHGNVLWAQHHNGIFRSTDSGAKWTEVKAPLSSFGFAVAVHPKDGDTAWFVPAVKDEKRVPVDGKLVVNRTRDGGKTFDTLRRGLPQDHAYDLVYRHALDVDGSGKRLAFGSTTGGLWTSDDQGDSWTQLPARLPPVYCVRFA